MIGSASVAAVAPAGSPVRVDVADLLALRQSASVLSLRSVAKRSVQSGARRSAFRARGMDYEESRRYQVGDDMRNLDWRVTARTGKPYTKLFREERERPVLLCVDLGPTMFFATRGVFKSVMAARCAALLSWAALAHGDRIGGVVFGGADHTETRPVRGKNGVLRLLSDLATPSRWEPDHERRDDAFDDAVSRVVHVAKPGSLVVMISDFMRLDDTSLALLKRISVHSDLLNVLVCDPLEQSLPAPGRYPITDRGTRWLLDSRGRANRDSHHQRFEERLEQVESLSRSARARSIVVATNDDAVQVMGQTLRGVMR
ncbi:MAG: DUF58 domain-containing protein [Gammaproteobacteria bacterium]